MVKNLPANAGDTGSVPGLGRSHLPRGSSACAPQLLKPVHPTARAPQEKPLQWEATHTSKSRPRSLQLEKSPCSHEDPAQPKIKTKETPVTGRRATPIPCDLISTDHTYKDASSMVTC